MKKVEFSQDYKSTVILFIKNFQLTFLPVKVQPGLLFYKANQ